MQEHRATAIVATSVARAGRRSAFSNGIRLTGRQWLGVGLFTFAARGRSRPRSGSRSEKFRARAGLSHPARPEQRLLALRALRRTGRRAARHVLIGDSVVWGEYVTPATRRCRIISTSWRATSGSPISASTAPIRSRWWAGRALCGQRARTRTWLLQCNPLWMSSPEADLQDDKASEFNHPRLVPQFVAELPAYKEEISPRLGVLVEQRLPFSSWTNHLQQAYYDRTDIPGWTLEHPYDNPLAPLARGLPPVGQFPAAPAAAVVQERHHQAGLSVGRSGDVAAMAGLPAAWSRSCRRRGNRVFVLVGPFNEHLLTPESLMRYGQVKATIAAWLIEKQVPHAIPAPLPSELYGDASHPLAAGYKMLAEQLAEEPFFRTGGSSAAVPLQKR